MSPGPYGRLCELVFLSRSHRRYRRRFRRDYREFNAQVQQSTSEWWDPASQRELIDPHPGSIAAFAEWFSHQWFSSDPDPDWIAINRHNFTQALRPRWWEFRRRWRRRLRLRPKWA
jgi:hypothetical protein